MSANSEKAVSLWLLVLVRMLYMCYEYSRSTWWW